MDKKYYVYFLRRPDLVDKFEPEKGQPFYIGRGRGNRVFTHRQHWRFTYLNFHPSKDGWTNTVPFRDLIYDLWDKGLDFEEEITLTDLTFEEALLYERQAIQIYGLIRYGGCLTNYFYGEDMYKETNHPLKAFFRAREIGQTKICKILAIKGLHQSTLSKWFTGGEPMPSHIEKRLQELANEILAKETAQPKPKQDSDGSHKECQPVPSPPPRGQG